MNCRFFCNQINSLCAVRLARLGTWRSKNSRCSVHLTRVVGRAWPFRDYVKSDDKIVMILMNSKLEAQSWTWRSLLKLFTSAESARGGKSIHICHGSSIFRLEAVRERYNVFTRTHDEELEKFISLFQGKEKENLSDQAYACDNLFTLLWHTSDVKENKLSNKFYRRSDTRRNRLNCNLVKTIF